MRTGNPDTRLLVVVAVLVLGVMAALASC